MAIATTAQLNQISNLYVSLFNRAPDTAGLSFWSSALANGANIQTITRGFLTAPEGQANYPQFQNASEFVNAFYTKVFGRAPDAGGLAFWTAALNGAGGANSDAAKATVVSQIVSIVSTPLTSRPDGLTDAQYLQTSNDRALFANKVEAGTYVATQKTIDVATATTLLNTVTADPTSMLTVKNTANVFGATLTAALDSANGTAVVGTASGDVFALTVAQIDIADSKAGFSLDGGAGSDTLVITTAGTITDTVKNFSNIETVYFSGTTTAAVGKFIGATTFNGSSGGALTLNGLAAGQTVGIYNTNFLTANYLAAATTAALTINASTTSTAISLTGSGLTSASISSTGAAANTVGTILLAGTIGAVTINAATALSTTLSGAKVGSTLTVNGGGAVALNTLPAAFTTINAGAATGGLTANIGTTVTSLTGSSAADKITVNGSLAAGTTINLGVGNDSLLFATNGVIAAGSTIDAGAGIDTLGSRLVTAANASVFKNFELLQIDAGSITDASLLTGSALTGLTLASGTGAGAVNNVSSTLGLTVTGAVNGGTTTIGVKDAATNTADTYTITLANATSGNAAFAGTIGLANVETVNIVSAGTVAAGIFNTIDISDGGLKTLNITGSQAASVTFSTATTATSLIDASAATGSIKIDTTNLVAATAANGGLTVKGGTAADSLTIGQNAVVTGGAGNDTFVLSSTAIQQAASPTLLTIAAKLVTITDFARGDVIDFLSTTNTATGPNITFADQSSAADLLTAVNNVVNNNAAATIEAFRFGGDTYIVADYGTAGAFGASDTLVKLSGIVDLSTVQANATTGEVFFGSVIVPI